MATGKTVQERARDERELLARELVERQPLAEEAAGREVRRGGFVHLARVEAAGAGVPRDEQIGDDHVEALVGGGQVAPPVVDDDADVAALEHAAVPGAEVRARCGGHLGHQLDNRGLVEPERRAGAGADAGGQADEQRPVRIGMQQQRHQPEAALVGCGRAAAEHVEVVEAELQVVRRLDHADDAARALGDGAQGFAAAQVHQRRAQRIGQGDEQQRRIRERAPAAAARGDDIGEDDVGQGDAE